MLKKSSDGQIWLLLSKELGQNFKNDTATHEAIQTLSRAFTSDRQTLADLNYLNDPQLQKGYLAYFLPLNFFKVQTVLTAHQNAMNLENSKISILDFGCGPGTASLAALQFISDQKISPELIEVCLVDAQKNALEKASKLIKAFAKILGLKVWVRIFRSLKDLEFKNNEFQADITFAVNVLNEINSLTGNREDDEVLNLWRFAKEFFLVLEPSHRVASQKLIRFRERLLKENDVLILGPCTHSQRCPLFQTKHWCHFSEPVLDDGLIKFALKVFKNPRLWLKFSYLLFQRKNATDALQPPSFLFRAIGDLHQSGSEHLSIDLCQPKTKKVLRLSKQRTPKPLLLKLERGALVTLDSYFKVKEVLPLTPRIKKIVKKKRPTGSPKRARGTGMFVRRKK